MTYEVFRIICYALFGNTYQRMRGIPLLFWSRRCKKLGFFTAVPYHTSIALPERRDNRSTSHGTTKKLCVPSSAVPLYSSGYARARLFVLCSSRRSSTCKTSNFSQTVCMQYTNECCLTLEWGGADDFCKATAGICHRPFFESNTTTAAPKTGRSLRSGLPV